METITKFSPTELDIIKEIISIAFSKSADSFALMAKQKILISYADLQFTQPPKVLINSDYDPKEELITVISDLIGDLTGKIILIFNKTDRQNLVKSCMDMEYTEDEEFKKMEAAFLLEFGNILTGSIVTQFSNIFHLKMYGKVPFIQSGLITKIMDFVTKDCELNSSMILTIQTEFVIKNIKLRPHLLLIFDETSLDKIQDIISNYDMNKKVLFSL